MKRFLVVLALTVAAFGLAQSRQYRMGVNGGGLTALPSSAVQTTTSASTYYVDPTGNDNGDCLNANTGACATITGALAKLPARVANNITIVVDAGTYTEQVAFTNMDVNANITFTTPGLKDAGTTTGTVDGTITAISNVVPAVVTDSNATWTVNDHIGKFLQITSGAQNGQIRVIAKNDATSLTLASVFATAPITGVSYAIRVPSVIVTNSSSPTLAMRLSGNSGSGAGTTATITMDRMDFINTTAVGIACVIAPSNQSISMTNSRCSATASTAIGVSYRGGGQLSLTGSVGQGTLNGLRLASLGPSASFNPSPTLSLSNSLLYGSSTTGVGVDGSSATVGVAEWAGTSGYTAQTGDTSGTRGAITLNSVFSRTTTGSGTPLLRCLAAGSNGIYQKGAAATVTNQAQIMFDNLYIDSCTVGIDLSTGLGNALVSVATAGTLTCVGATTCLKTANGSRIHVSGTFIPDAGSANVQAINIDGTNFTAADLTGASPTRLPTTANTTGSSVWQ